MARVTFVLPAAGAEPVGGFRAVYRCANAAATMGHSVSIVHSAELYLQDHHHWLFTRLRQQRSYLLGADYRPTAWLPLHLSIRTSYVWWVRDSVLPDADVLVATGWSTARPVAAAVPSKGRKFYLIQGYETFAGPEDAVLASWRLPARKIVISPWLLAQVQQQGEEADLLQYGVDLDTFGLDAPIRMRSSSVAVLSHPAPGKGFDTALRAIALVRSRLPPFRVESFGVGPPPRGLPGWVEYSRRPSQTELRALYNRTSIFLAPSLSEGWGLPPAEAQACGAAVCASDIGGHRAYLTDGVTALLSPPGDHKALAARLASLLYDDERRVALALAGHEEIQAHSLQRTTEEFLRLVGLC